jgi:hypothetical protein
MAKAASTGYADPDSYPVDIRGVTYTLGLTGIKRLGTAQFYLTANKDKDGSAFDGNSTYRLPVPASAPVKQYWSATVYDRETHTLVRNMTRASAASISSGVQKNADGSVDVFFGPKAPAGKAANLVPTDPARKFELLFRLYQPEKPLFGQELEAAGRRGSRRPVTLRPAACRDAEFSVLAPDKFPLGISRPASRHLNQSPNGGVAQILGRIA